MPKLRQLQLTPGVSVSDIATAVLAISDRTEKNGLNRASMIYDPRRAALALRQRIIDSMTPEERAQAGEDSAYTVEMIRDEPPADESPATVTPRA